MKNKGALKLSEWIIEKVKKVCTNCSEGFEPGSELYSGIIKFESKFTRKDYCLTCWESKKDELFSYWKTYMPQKGGRSRENVNALVDFFKNLLLESGEDIQKEKVKYLLAIILIRRRRLKLLKNLRRENLDYMLLEKSWDGETIELKDPLISEDELDSLKVELEQLFDFELKPPKDNICGKPH